MEKFCCLCAFYSLLSLWKLSYISEDFFHSKDANKQTFLSVHKGKTSNVCQSLFNIVMKGASNYFLMKFIWKINKHVNEIFLITSVAEWKTFASLLSSFLMCIETHFFQQKGGNVLQLKWSRFSRKTPKTRFLK